MLEIVTFEIEDYDRQNGLPSDNYDPLTSTFTAPLTGNYHFDGLVEISYAGALTSTVRLSANVNGVPLTGRRNVFSNSSAVGVNRQALDISFDYFLNAGDVVNLSIINLPPNPTISIITGYFNGHYISN